MPETFPTADAQLAAYLCLLGYDEPQYEQRGRRVFFIFATVVDEDVLRFSSCQPAYIAPLTLLRKYEYLVGQARLVTMNMARAAFQSSPTA